jgi:hypothetical protein
LPGRPPSERQGVADAAEALQRLPPSTCPSAFLYALNKGDASTPEMQRGSGLHAVIERSTRAAIDQGEPFIPPEVVKAIVNEVLADPEFAIPVEEHDYLRESAYRWAGEWSVDPAAVVAAETMFVLDLAAIRCGAVSTSRSCGSAARWCTSRTTSRAVRRRRSRTCRASGLMGR